LQQFVEACIHTTSALEMKFDDWAFQSLIFGYIVGRHQVLRRAKPLRPILDRYYHLWDERPHEATRFILNALTGYARGRRWAI
jgi:hypothetical protein